MEMKKVYKVSNHAFRQKGLRKSRHQIGQTLVEYALIIAIISIVAIGVMLNMGQQLKGTYSNITSDVATANGSH
jgi:Flp pilus assembly pilin Flp